MTTLNLDRLLTREQKQGIVKERLQREGVRGPFRLRYDCRFGWDFEVKKGTWPTVIFSVPIMSPRLGEAIRECVRAIEDMRSGTQATMVRFKGE